MSDNIVDFGQEKINKEQPSLIEVISGFTSNNCDPDRPYIEQQPLRAKMEIKGLTRRDICDCMVLGILECKPGDSIPRIYLSEEGTAFSSFDALLESGETYDGSVIDHECVTYNDLYGWDLNTIDPVAAIQNMACYLEQRMGVFPALLDGRLGETEE